MDRKILNKTKLNDWFHERRKLGHDASSIMASYDDGGPILKSFNVAWRDDVTGDTIWIEYGKGVDNER